MSKVSQSLHAYMYVTTYTIPCTCTIGSVHVWIGPFVVTQIVLIWPTLKCEVVFQLVCKTNLNQTWHMYFGSPMECKSGLSWGDTGGCGGTQVALVPELHGRGAHL